MGATTKAIKKDFIRMSDHLRADGFVRQSEALEVTRRLDDGTCHHLSLDTSAGLHEGEIRLIPEFAIEQPELGPLAHRLLGPESHESRTVLANHACVQLVPNHERPEWIARSPREVSIELDKIGVFLGEIVVPFLDVHGGLEACIELIANNDYRVHPSESTFVLAIAGALLICRDDLARKIADRMFSGWKGRRERYHTTVEELRLLRGWTWSDDD